MASSKEPYGQQAFVVKPQAPSLSHSQHGRNSTRALEQTRQPIFRGYINGQFPKHGPLPSKIQSHQFAPAPAPTAAPKKQRAPFQVRFTQPMGASNLNSSSRETSVSLEDGPPMKRAKKFGSLQTKPTRLTTRKPVISAIHMDAWKLIFEFCEPSFLLYVVRPLCREFRDALDHQDIWRKSRLNYFGTDMPECPQSVTEQQYVNLLVGRGCQNSSCDRRETRKVYWPFMLRLCDSCFRQATRTPQSYEEYRELLFDFEEELFTMHEELGTISEPSDLPKSFFDLLPCGLVESGRYMGPRRLNDDSTRWALPQSPAKIVLDRDVEVLVSDFRRANPSRRDEITAWTKAKWDATRQHMMTVAALQEWEHTRRDDNADLRERRRAFFALKARQMTPPMSMSILDKMVAFHNAINTTNAPSDRAWAILQKKVESPELRKQAKLLLEWDNSWLHVAEDYPKTTDILRAHRSIERYTFKSLPEEQELVLTLGKEEFAKLDHQCHDQDLLLLCLRNVRRVYEQLPHKPSGLNYDLSRGEYRLSLADALMVVEEIIQPRVGVSTNRGKEVLELFRCIGCTRTDCTKTRDFRDVFEHVNKTHAQCVGEGLQFYRLAEPVRSATEFTRRVAWLQLPWFKSMPMLPGHGKVTASTRWDPDVEAEYIEFAESGAESAFEHRQACDDPTIDLADFPSNFAFAAELLRPTRLDGLTTTKIALQYAMDRYWMVSGNEDGVPDDPPRLAVFSRAIFKARQVNSKLNFKFRCGACIKDKSGSKHNRQVRSAVSFDVLEDHWGTKHAGLGNNWEENLMDLPSGSQVMANMLKEDEKLRQDQEKCRVREAGLSQVPSSKRADRKATALLDLRASVEVFDELFPRRVR